MNRFNVISVTNSQKDLPLPDTCYFKPNVVQQFAVENIPAVKNKGWFHHVGMYPLPVVGFKFVPLGKHCNGMGVLHGLIRCVVHNYQLPDLFRGEYGFLVVFAAVLLQVFQIGINPGRVCLRVVNVYPGFIVQQLVSHINGSAFAGVVGIFFKSPAQKGNFFGKGMND